MVQCFEDAHACDVRKNNPYHAIDVLNLKSSDKSLFEYLPKSCRNSLSLELQLTDFKECPLYSFLKPFFIIVLQ